MASVMSNTVWNKKYHASLTATVNKQCYQGPWHNSSSRMFYSVFNPFWCVYFCLAVVWSCCWRGEVTQIMETARAGPPSTWLPPAVTVTAVACCWNTGPGSMSAPRWVHQLSVIWTVVNHVPSWTIQHCQLLLSCVSVHKSFYANCKSIMWVRQLIINIYISHN